MTMRYTVERHPKLEEQKFPNQPLYNNRGQKSYETPVTLGQDNEKKITLEPGHILEVFSKTGVGPLMTVIIKRLAEDGETLKEEGRVTINSMNTIYNMSTHKSQYNIVVK